MSVQSGRRLHHNRIAMPAAAQPILMHGIVESMVGTAVVAVMALLNASGPCPVTLQAAHHNSHAAH